MRLANAALLLVLAGCGDSPPDRPPSPAPLPPGVSATPSAADLERLREARARAAALDRRPLTAADLEAYVALLPGWRDAGVDQAKQEALLVEHRLTLQEWRVLDGRVRELVRELEGGMPDPKRAADVATVRPYLERILAARPPR